MTTYIGGAENNRWTLTTADGESSADGGDGRDTLTIRLFDQTDFTHATWNGVTGSVMASSGISFTDIETLNFYFSDYAGTFSHTGPNVAHVHGGAGGDAVTLVMGDTVDGGGGVNSVQFNFTQAKSGVTFVNGGVAGVTYTALVHGHAAGSVANVEMLTVYGGEFDDRIGGAYSVYDFEPGFRATLNGKGGADTAVIDFSGADHVVCNTSYPTFIGYDASEAERTTINLAEVEQLDFTGGSGDDYIVVPFPLLDSILRGGSGQDVLIAGNGDDVVSGGPGDDTLDGGSGVNTASYADATENIHVALYLQGSTQYTGVTGTDTLTNFANLIGSAYDDELSGDGHDNLLEGGPGNDTLNGAGGIDTASYASAPAGVTVSLDANAAQDTGGAGSDFIYNVENLLGSAFADTLTGTTFVASVLSGGGGDDTLSGGLADDTLDGGDGTDTASFATAMSGVTVSLAIVGPQNTAGAGTDTLIGIENLTGSALGDRLSGNGDANRLAGGGGDDRLIGGGGADLLIGGLGKDVLSGGAGADRFAFAGGDTGAIAAKADLVTDFSRVQHDQIDLSAIDAIAATPALNAFHFIRTAAFSGKAGELRYDFSGANTLVLGDTDGDKTADLVIRLTGHATLVGGDFILTDQVGEAGPSIHGLSEFWLHEVREDLLPSMALA